MIAKPASPRTSTLLLAALASAAFFHPARADVRYALNDLGTLGGLSSWATNINDSGQILGGAYDSTNYGSPTFLYSNHSMTNISALLAPIPFDGRSLNSNAQIAGDAYVASFSHAAIYSNSHLTDLGTLGGNWSHAYGINDYGQIAGYSFTSNNRDLHAFVYDNGNMIDITPPYAGDSAANAINNLGQAVGWLDGAYGDNAFLYTNGTTLDIGSLGIGANALAINDLGQVVGYSMLNDQSTVHPFLYSNGVMTDLGSLGGSLAFARAINNLGQIVGDSRTINDSDDAFVVINGTMLDLNSCIDPSLQWTLIEANDINNLGQIVGEGFNSDGALHAFLLTPDLPEPAILLAVLLLIPARRPRH